jgi:YD repeat-containing protein
MSSRSSSGPTSGIRCTSSTRSRRQLATVTDPLNHTWTVNYDAAGKVTSITTDFSAAFAAFAFFRGRMGYCRAGEPVRLKRDTTEFFPRTLPQRGKIQRAPRIDCQSRVQAYSNSRVD